MAKSIIKTGTMPLADTLAARDMKTSTGKPIPEASAFADSLSQAASITEALTLVDQQEQVRRYRDRWGDNYDINIHGILPPNPVLVFLAQVLDALDQRLAEVEGGKHKPR